MAIILPVVAISLSGKPKQSNFFFFMFLIFFSTVPGASTGYLCCVACVFFPCLARTEQILCEAGYYCVAGTKYLCQGNNGGNYPAPGPEFCLDGAKAKYCPEGSTSPLAVDTGYYTGSNYPNKWYEATCLNEYPCCATQYTQSLCEPGFYCVGGNKEFCGDDRYYCPGTGNTETTLVPNGYIATGLSNQRDDIQICSTGYYCRLGIEQACNIGYNCPPGMSIATGLGKCPAGYVCPFTNQGAIGPHTQECVAATNNQPNKYYCPEGSRVNTLVSEGYYTIGGTERTRTGQKLCEAGYACNDGVRETCGSWSPTAYDNDYFCEGRSSEGTQVSAGYYSTGGNETTRTGQSPCDDGYYCDKGERIMCQPGVYCPPVSTSDMAVPCTQGIYKNTPPRPFYFILFYLIFFTPFNPCPNLHLFHVVH